MATAISELAPRIPPKQKVLFEEYIEWLDEDTRAESKDLGHVVLAPYVMRMAAIARGREPDLIFVQKDRWMFCAN